jgi:hypothetical protein
MAFEIAMALRHVFLTGFRRKQTDGWIIPDNSVVAIFLRLLPIAQVSPH